MKVTYDDLSDEQKDFHEFRKKGIGSSDAPAIMGCSPWLSIRELWELKMGLRQPEPQNYQMKRGLDLEPFARDSYENKTGILMPKDRDIHPTFDFIRTNMDGVNHHAGMVLEIKCPGKDDHAKAVEGKIPDKYIWQCAHHLLVTGLAIVDYYSFDGKDGVIVPYKRDAKKEAELLAKEIAFWKCVETKTPPSDSPSVDGVFRMRRNR